MACVVAGAAALPSDGFALASQVSEGTGKALSFGEPIAGLSAADEERFRNGFAVFIRHWTPAQGLGPNFNGQSCVGCHRVPLPGGSGTSDKQTFVAHAPGACDAFGSNSIRRMAISEEGVKVRELRFDEHSITFRRAPPLFGLGLLEAISSNEILRNLQRGRQIGHRPRLSVVRGQIGKFGVTASAPDILSFTAQALSTEIGIASVVAESLATTKCPGDRASPAAEISHLELESLTFYLQHLAPPPVTPAKANSIRGRVLFAELRCIECHRPSYSVRYGNTQRVITINPFTDMLLYRTQPDCAASRNHRKKTRNCRPNYVRTAPLWGVWATGPPYLHDGRAHSLSEAVSMHTGDGRRSAVLFQKLSADEQKALIDFLKGL